MSDLATLTPAPPVHHHRTRAGAYVPGAGRWVPALAFAGVMVLTVWILSPRFQAHFPWVVDDWYAIHYSPNALHHLLRLDYVPSEVHDSLRFRPSYAAVWNYLQWHTLDGPTGMKGANVWNLVRVGLLVGGVMVLAIAGVPARRRTGWTVAFGVLAALVLVATPEMMFEIAQFGPVEPLMMGAMITGGAVLVVGGAMWLRGRRAAVVAPVLIGGWLLWVFGTFEKEASICALAFAPFLAMELARRARESGLVAGPLWREPKAIAVGVAAIVPLLFMLWEVKKISSGGKTVYGNEIHGGAFGLLTNAHQAFVGMWGAVEAKVGTPLFAALAIASAATVLGSAAARRRVPWFALGLVVTGWVLFVFEGLGGEFFPRYYLPTIVMFLGAIAVSLADAPHVLRVAAALAGALFVVTNIGAAHHRVLALAVAQQQGAQTVSRIAALHPGHCRVYMARMANEPAESLPILSGLVPGVDHPGCLPGYEATMVDGAYNVALVTDDRILRACASPGGWRPVDRTPLYLIRGCRRLATGQVGGRDVAQVLGADRVVPGTGLRERK